MFVTLSKNLFRGAALALLLSSSTLAQGFAGAFLAAKSANIANDYEQAAHYYTRALRAEPDNGFIMQGAMVANVAAGHLERGAQMAQRMSDAGYNDPYAQTALIAYAVSQGDFDDALALLRDDRFDLNPLITSLATGWVLIGSGNFAEGLAHFENTDQNDAIDAFARYNRALALAYAGDYESAESILANVEESAYVNRGAVLAHAQLLVLLGQPERALDLMTVGTGRTFGDLESEDLRNRIAAGAPIAFDRITKPQDGVAEAFMVLADALNDDSSARLALFFARLAHGARDDYAEALLLIGDVLAEQQQVDLAVAAYGAVPDDNLLALNARIGQSSTLRQNDRMDEAIIVLRDLLAEYPDELTIWRNLGEILRIEGEFDEAHTAYTTAIDLLPDPDMAAAWRLHYSRAIISSNQSDWPAAEADFRRALVLNPDQADVLNYLGYSLVERREHLDEALEMIETAAEARPDSGYIIDSLGWVYYRLGRFEEAATAMEQAVKLIPVDSILNDHLGDTLWMVGRKREAIFQWSRALSFDPDEEDLIRIRRKLEVGLDVVLEEEALAQDDN